MDNSTTPLRRCKECGIEYPATKEFFHLHKKKFLDTRCKGCRNPRGWPLPKREGYQTCTHCLQEFPATLEFFTRRDRNGGGFHSWCRECVKEDRVKKQRAAGVKPKKISQTRDGVKQCVQCKEWKPATDSYFVRSSRNKDGLIGTCKECRKPYFVLNRDWINQRSREWYRNNPEQARTTRDAYAAAHPEQIAVYKRRYLVRHHDRIMVRRKRHYQENKPHYKAKHYAREDRIRGMPNNFRREDWEFALRYFEGRCAVCGRLPGFWHTLAEDHWKPITDPDCPGTVVGNIVPLCHGHGGCNNSKCNLDPDVWLVKKRGKTKAAVISARIKVFFEEAKKYAAVG